MSSRPLTMQFPVYQIDFSAVAAGKRVAATKRRIRWYVYLFIYSAVLSIGNGIL